MLNIPEVIKELFMQDGIRKNFRVHFPNGERADLVNKDIVEESVKFTESLCSQQTLKFGLTEASAIEFECVGVENIAGMTIQCGIEIDVSSLSREDRQTYGTRTEDVPFPFYAVPYGVFIVEKCPIQADTKRRRVTGYTRPGVGKVSLGAAQRSKTLTVDADAILAAGWLQAADTEDATTDVLRNTNAGVNGDYYFSLWPTLDPDQVIQKRATIEVTTDAKVAVLVETTESWGNLQMEVMRRVSAAAPSGYTKNEAGIQVFPNTMGGVYGRCAGVLTSAVLRTETVSGGESYSYPVILEENALSIINCAALRMAPIYGAVVTPENVARSTLIVGVWVFLSAFLRLITSTEREVSLYDLIPTGKMRDASIFYTELPPTDGTDAVLTADGKISLPGLGEYFEFLSDLSADELIDATLETRGSFGSVERVGRTREITLSNDNTEEITPESIASLWFEEYTLEPPGSVLYPYLDGSEELIGETVFRDGGGYDLTSNKLLKEEAVRTQNAIREQILASFPENTAKARYTPIDLTIKARPWLEDGDAIRVTTPEGEVIESYILRHTISGVQHLEDNIEAEGVGE